MARLSFLGDGTAILAYEDGNGEVRVPITRQPF